jgi:hypothetical protein
MTTFHDRRTGVLITTGGVGTDENKLARHNINSPQGMRAVARKVEDLSAQTGKPAWAETRGDSEKAGRLEPRVIYGKKQ